MKIDFFRTDRLSSLNPGDVFQYNDNNIYILTNDNVENDEALCVRLCDGFCKWLPKECLVTELDARVVAYNG